MSAKGEKNPHVSETEESHVSETEESDAPTPSPPKEVKRRKTGQPQPEYTSSTPDEHVSPNPSPPSTATVSANVSRRPVVSVTLCPLEITHRYTRALEHQERGNLKVQHDAACKQCDQYRAIFFCSKCREPSLNDEPQEICEICFDKLAKSITLVDLQDKTDRYQILTISIRLDQPGKLLPRVIWDALCSVLSTLNMCFTHQKYKKVTMTQDHSANKSVYYQRHIE
jgi:hypothetical protein